MQSTQNLSFLHGIRAKINQRFRSNLLCRRRRISAAAATAYPAAAAMSSTSALTSASAAALTAPATLALTGSSMSAGLSSSTPPPPFNFAHLITVKLSSENFLFWRAQVVPLLRSNSLMGYVDGSVKCPAAEITMTVDGRRLHLRIQLILLGFNRIRQSCQRFSPR